MSIVPASIGYQHVVSSGHELASYAAFEVLENGGNAVDAGIAAILALGVLYSDQVSVAGVAPMVIRSGSTGEIVTITGLGYWPHGVAGVCAVKKDLKSGRITGGADPRRMSRAMGR